LKLQGFEPLHFCGIFANAVPALSASAEFNFDLKHCGELFLPIGRSDSVYCNRVKPGQTQSCKKLGANLVAAEKRKNNPALQEYRSVYDRMYKLRSENSLSRDDFDNWNEQARIKRDACTNGKLTLKKYIEWLDNTSRRRKKKE